MSEERDEDEAIEQEREVEATEGVEPVSEADDETMEEETEVENEEHESEQIEDRKIKTARGEKRKHKPIAHVKEESDETGGRALGDAAKREIGQTLLTLELERRGWMIFSPHIEEKVDLVAVRESANGRLRHAYIQVKTAAVSMQNSFEFTLQASKLIESRDFYCVLVCLKDAKFRVVDFHIVPSLDLRKVLAKYFESPTWEKNGSFNFALRLGGRWERYRNRFDFIRPN